MKLKCEATIGDAVNTYRCQLVRDHERHLDMANGIAAEWNDGDDAPTLRNSPLSGLVQFAPQSMDRLADEWECDHPDFYDDESTPQGE